MQTDYLTKLLGIPGYRVTKVKPLTSQGGHESVRLHLDRTGGTHICGRCGSQVSGGYDHTWQEFRHLTLWQHQTILRLPRYRADCPQCGVQTEALEFVGVRGPRVTRAMTDMIHQLCKVTTVKAVSLLFGLHRHTVKEIDKAALMKTQAEHPLDNISVLGMDEIGVGKGHKYWTLISALDGPRGPELLNVVEGRSEKRGGVLGQNPTINE